MFPSTCGPPLSKKGYLWQKNVSGVPESFESLTQAYWNPEFWFFTK